MKLHLVLSIALVSLTFVPLAIAKPDLPPLVGGCVGDACGDGTLACVGFSYQVPQCVEEPPAQSGAIDQCVQYAYVADYHWYWVCVDPKGGACAVYFKEQHGASVTRSCAL